VKGLARNPGEWVKSSHSEGSQGRCVEALFTPGRTVQVRDSQRPGEERIGLPLSAWLPFVHEIRSEES
jgi:hypothetical protein